MKVNYKVRNLGKGMYDVRQPLPPTGNFAGRVPRARGSASHGALLGKLQVRIILLPHCLPETAAVRLLERGGDDRSNSIASRAFRG